MTGECAECACEDSMGDNLSKQLSLLANAFGYLSTSREVDSNDVVQSVSGESFRIVHKNDWDALKKFCKSFRSYKSSKSEPEDIRQEVMRCFKSDEAMSLAGSSENDEFQSLDELDRRTLELASKLSIPLKCKKHDFPIAGVVTKSTSDSTPPSFSDHMRLLNGSDHRSYVSFLCAVANILVLSEEKRDIDVVDENGTLGCQHLMELCAEKGAYDCQEKRTETDSQVMITARSFLLREGTTLGCQL